MVVRDRIQDRTPSVELRIEVIKPRIQGGGLSWGNCCACSGSQTRKEFSTGGPNNLVGSLLHQGSNALFYLLYFDSATFSFHIKCCLQAKKVNNVKVSKVEYFLF